jgi:flagellar hook assembly protein FlgD
VVKEVPQTTGVRSARPPLIRLTSRPNPFTSQVQLDYTVPAVGNVTLTVYNVRGQRVRLLRDHRDREGAHVATWDGRDDRGERVAQGVYFASLRFRGETRTVRLVLVH